MLCVSLMSGSFTNPVFVSLCFKSRFKCALRESICSNQAKFFITVSRIIDPAFLIVFYHRKNKKRVKADVLLAFKEHPPDLGDRIYTTLTSAEVLSFESLKIHLGIPFKIKKYEGRECSLDFLSSEEPSSSKLKVKLFGWKISSRKYTENVLLNILSQDWSTATDPQIHLLGPRHIFAFLFSKKERKARIRESGPWYIHKSLMVNVEWYPKLAVEKIDFSNETMRVQVLDGLTLEQTITWLPTPSTTGVVLVVLFERSQKLSQEQHQASIVVARVFQASSSDSGFYNTGNSLGRCAMVGSHRVQNMRDPVAGPVRINAHPREPNTDFDRGLEADDVQRKESLVILGLVRNKKYLEFGPLSGNKEENFTDKEAQSNYISKPVSSLKGHSFCAIGTLKWLELPRVTEAT